MKSLAQSASRFPISQETISLESLSCAVHVHTSPASPASFLASGVFFALEPTNDHISPHCTLRAFTLRTLASWKASQASPAWISSLVTVLMLTSASLETERIEAPSQSIERIWARVSAGSL